MLEVKRAVQALLPVTRWCWGFADEKGRFDEVVEEGGVRILIEPAALMHVIGTTMDFVENRIKCAAFQPLPLLTIRAFRRFVSWPPSISCLSGQSKWRGRFSPI